MTERADDAALSAGRLAEWAAAVFAVDPQGTGVSLRARPGPQRDRWLALLRQFMPGQPIRKIPPDIGDDRLLGGLDLAGTLAAGRPVGERGILADADDGVVLIPSAERASAGLAARIGAVHECSEIRLERDGLRRTFSARFGMLLIDEGLGPDEQPPSLLMDRIAMRCDLSAVPFRALGENPEFSAGDIARAKACLPDVEASGAGVEALCAAALALGISTVRAPLLALRVAKAIAALEGRRQLSPADLSLAAQLALAWRAEYLPQSEPDSKGEEELQPNDEAEAESPDDMEQSDDGKLDDVVLAAAEAAIPRDLLARLLAERSLGGKTGPGGRMGALKKSGKRGRRMGVMRGDPRSGLRLDLIATLRTAAPWQRIRARDGESAARLQIRSSDFRTIRFAERSETLTIFAVDASGSLALNRLAEAKGAVELLLADCYRRRDQVAVIAFRGAKAEMLLPPTRSLVRAKRCLSGLPGGGGTPLASGMDMATAQAQLALRRGQTPLIVLLTDGRANISRTGQPGRSAALSDARSSALALRECRVRSLLIDTSPRPDPRAEELAAAMDAAYLALPHMDADAISGAVKAAMGGSASGNKA
ncbi:MAG: magnesium chelatase subunit D [Rhodomicrobiaceae bacterium]